MMQHYSTQMSNYRTVKANNSVKIEICQLKVVHINVKFNSVLSRFQENNFESNFYLIDEIPLVFFHQIHLVDQTKDLGFWRTLEKEKYCFLVNEQLP